MQICPYLILISAFILSRTLGVCHFWLCFFLSSMVNKCKIERTPYTYRFSFLAHSLSNNSLHGLANLISFFEQHDTHRFGTTQIRFLELQSNMEHNCAWLWLLCNGKYYRMIDIKKAPHRLWHFLLQPTAAAAFKRHLRYTCKIKMFSVFNQMLQIEFGCFCTFLCVWESGLNNSWNIQNF